MIVLTTLNSKYIHASLGLRYLFANLGELQSRAKLQEFTIHQRAIDIAEELLSHSPKIIGIGVYIWNIEESLELVKLLKVVAPEVIIVAGGPEVSYETEEHPIAQSVDYVLTGPADKSFAHLCHQILDYQHPSTRVLRSKPLDLKELILPYDLYNQEDLANRLIYVEASRGCPFKCEFCLSALDKTSYPFDTDKFLAAIENLHRRGARHFKFVDRTFNLKIATTLRILEFFLQRMSEDLFLHFEVIPDHLPDKLKALLSQFPAGSLQFEVGIQTFNEEVQQAISRKQNNEKSRDNLKWLREHTTAHIHADLIFGLPGETLETFGQSFDQLYACKPHEIQLGILKRLKGSPIIRHTDTYEMRYSPLPPYNILSNRDVDFATMQRMNRFARYWDMIGNSGRFLNTLPYLLNNSPFANFMQLSDWLWQTTHQTHKIQLKKLFELLLTATQRLDNFDRTDCWKALASDFEKSKLKGRLSFPNEILDAAKPLSSRNQGNRSRQQRHLS